MNDVIESDEFDVVREALEEGSIGLDKVARRFVDFKMAYCKDDPKLEFNDRSQQWTEPLEDKEPRWRKLSKNELEAIFDHCYLKCSTDPLKRWQAYYERPKSVYKLKLTDSAQKERLGFSSRARFCKFGIDCDGSKSSEIVPKATNLLYATLWPNTIADSADTINSFGKTYTRAHANEPKVEAQLNILAYLTHTLGNFIPCSAPFQIFKNWGGDYMDLALLRIKKWYLGKPPTQPGYKKKLDGCKDWLNDFPPNEPETTNVERWNAFIKENDLLAYTNGKDEHDAYKVRRFYVGHDIGASLPDNAENVLECLLSMNAAIIARGNKMGKELEEKINKGKLERADWKLFFKDPYPQSSSSPR